MRRDRRAVWRSVWRMAFLCKNAIGGRMGGSACTDGRRGEKGEGEGGGKGRVDREGSRLWRRW